MTINSITGNYRIDQIIAMGHHIFDNPSHYVKTLACEDFLTQKFRDMPWSRKWWNNYDGIIRVVLDIGSLDFYKRRDDFWFKTKYIVRKFNRKGSEPKLGER